VKNTNGRVFYKSSMTLMVNWRPEVPYGSKQFQRYPTYVYTVTARATESLHKAHGVHHELKVLTHRHLRTKMFASGALIGVKTTTHPQYTNKWPEAYPEVSESPVNLHQLSFICHLIYGCEPRSSVSIVTGYGLVDWGSIPDGCGGSFLHLLRPADYGDHPAAYNGYRE
jgi:hypothetical protein